ncbi:MAG: IS91 family transposase [Chloroflexi bacterium]|nr:IS91 family transposase [Chloroflexota bacterium]
MALELADIFRQYGPAYRQKYADRLLPSHRRAMRAIEQCRTPALGGQVYSCPQCNQTQYSYHSCRNRHCPKCQNDKAQEWLEKQQNFLLPVPYFMLTFTIPAALRPVARSHQALVYDLLFRASAAATQHLAQDPRFVGGQLGLIGVLHTWGRNLSYHPHIHYLVPAGGLTSDHRTWLPAHHHFLLPVKALSRIFRAKFLHALQRSSLANDIPATVWKQDWVVHCKPIGNGRTALKYLAPYIFRVAISNRRLVKLENDQVTFRYRSSATGQITFCTLSAEEFIHRFLQHVLPRGFVKIRYFGFFGSSQRLLLAALRLLLETDTHSPLPDELPPPSPTLPKETLLCPI